MEPYETEDEICEFDYFVFTKLKLSVEIADKMTLYELTRWIQYGNTNNKCKTSIVNVPKRKPNVQYRQPINRLRIKKVK